MRGIGTAPPHAPGTSLERLHKLSPDGNMAAFTRELAPAVTLTRWRRQESCDALLANGGMGWVVSGVIRKYLVRENGQRRIVELLMPGDYFGLRPDDAHHFSLEAATDGTLTAGSTRRRLDRLAATSPQFYRFFYDRACETIARLEEHILAQGRTTAAEKVAGYLLLMSSRLSGESGSTVTLPVSRYDIADHLGIAVETVSRAITELRRDGLIELEGPRHLAIRNAQRLAEGRRSERS
jgi:CRP-like cAMP-binding protein